MQKILLVCLSLALLFSSKANSLQKNTFVFPFETKATVPVITGWWAYTYYNNPSDPNSAPGLHMAVEYDQGVDHPTYCTFSVKIWRNTNGSWGWVYVDYNVVVPSYYSSYFMNVPLNTGETIDGSYTIVTGPY